MESLRHVNLILGCVSNAHVANYSSVWCLSREAVFLSLPLGEHSKDKFCRSFFKSRLSHVSTAHMNRGISFKDYFWLSRKKRCLSSTFLSSLLALKLPETEKNLQVSDGLQSSCGCTVLIKTGTSKFICQSPRTIHRRKKKSLNGLSNECSDPDWCYLSPWWRKIQKRQETNISFQVNLLFPI